MFKSWVVFKGFLLCVGEKCLVVEVEDYLLLYVMFEGDIFEGYYGVGYVDVYDYGIWVCDGDLLEVIVVGKVDFVLYGEWFKGGWKLVWIVMKGK